jgi:hypothetical protein
MMRRRGARKCAVGAGAKARAGMGGMRCAAAGERWAPAASLRPAQWPAGPDAQPHAHSAHVTPPSMPAAPRPQARRGPQGHQGGHRGDDARVAGRGGLKACGRRGVINWLAPALQLEGARRRGFTRRHSFSVNSLAARPWPQHGGPSACAASSQVGRGVTPPLATARVPAPAWTGAGMGTRVAPRDFRAPRGRRHPGCDEHSTCMGDA